MCYNIELNIIYVRYLIAINHRLYHLGTDHAKNIACASLLHSYIHTRICAALWFIYNYPIKQRLARAKCEYIERISCSGWGIRSNSTHSMERSAFKVARVRTYNIVYEELLWRQRVREYIYVFNTVDYSLRSCRWCALLWNVVSVVLLLLVFLLNIVIICPSFFSHASVYYEMVNTFRSMYRTWILFDKQTMRNTL